MNIKSIRDILSRIFPGKPLFRHGTGPKFNAVCVIID